MVELADPENKPFAENDIFEKREFFNIKFAFGTKSIMIPLQR